jgi:flagellar basal body rod protein FlgF
MVRRLLLIAGLITATFFVFGGPARAADYAGLSVTASQTNVAPGDTITISGTGARPNSTVTATINGKSIGSGTASATGTFSFSVTIPSDVSGTVTVSVSDGSSAGVGSVTLTVASTSAQPLARTGSSNAVPATTLAVGLITAGVVALGLSRRRRHSKTVA